METHDLASGLSRPLPASLPITSAEFRRLQAEVEILASGLWQARATAQVDHVSGEPERPTVLAAGELYLRERRLATLRRVLAAAEIVDSPGPAVIGTSVTVRHNDGEVETYRLVVPGDGDPHTSAISPDSPLGAALIGRSAGDEVSLASPAGSSTVRILEVAAGPLEVCP